MSVEDISSEEFLNAFGVEAPQEETEESTEETPGEEEEQSSSSSEAPDSQEQTDSQEETDSQETQQTEETQQTQEQDKTAQAFAAMRVQNKKYEQLLKGMAEVLDVQDTDDPDKLSEALKDKVVQAQAKKQNVDPELLSRLKQLEERDQQYTQEERRKEAYLGFQRVKEQFDLDDTSLKDFANQLVQEGLNPFEEQVNLTSAYIERNYQKLVADAEARGAQKEAERAANAGSHSTSPGSTQGGTGDEAPQEVNSISDLDKWMSKQT